MEGSRSRCAHDLDQGCVGPTGTLNEQARLSLLLRFSRIGAAFPQSIEGWHVAVQASYPELLRSSEVVSMLVIDAIYLHYIPYLRLFHHLRP